MSEQRQTREQEQFIPCDVCGGPACAGQGRFAVCNEYCDNVAKRYIEYESTITTLEAARSWVPVRLYNAGYAAGHDDTVEACYTDVADCDKDTYHADIVAELLEHYLSAQPSNEGVL